MFAFRICYRRQEGFKFPDIFYRRSYIIVTLQHQLTSRKAAVNKLVYLIQIQFKPV